MFKKIFKVLVDSFLFAFSTKDKDNSLSKYQRESVTRANVYNGIRTGIPLSVIIFLCQIFYFLIDMFTGNFTSERLFQEKYVFSMIGEIGLCVTSIIFIIVASLMVDRKDENVYAQKSLLVFSYGFYAIFLSLYTIGKILREGQIVNIDSSIIFLTFILMLSPLYKRRYNYLLLGYMALVVLAFDFVIFANPDIVSVKNSSLDIYNPNFKPGFIWVVFNDVFLVIGAIVSTYIYGLNVKREIQSIKIKEANKELSQIVEIDDLTQINNRRALNLYVRKKEHEWKESKAPVGFYMMDIDFFKFYNDTYGHQKGDDCLRAVAQSLKQSADKFNGQVFRYGGEEFMIIVENFDEDSAVSLAKEIHAGIAELKMLHEGIDKSGNTNVTISIGLSIEKNFNEDSDSWILKSDQQLYRAKHEGRNCTSYKNKIFKG